MTSVSLKVHLAKRFPGLVFPDKAAVRPGELVGFLEKLLQSDPECREAAEKHLPVRSEGN